MLKNSEIKEKLGEMIKSKKADSDILTTLNNDEIEIEKIQKNLEILNSELYRIAEEIENIKLDRKQIAIYKIKELSAKTKEISDLKKKYKERSDEIAYLNEISELKLNEISDICKMTNSQYIVYQENEIYTKSIEKITEKNIELSTEFYAKYVNHVNKYMNSVFSIKNNTILEEPSHNDLAIVLNILQKNEKRLKDTETVEEPKKKTTRKRATKKANEDNTDKDSGEVTEKKTTRKRATKKASEDSVKKDNGEVEEKKITRKRATKKASEDNTKKDSSGVEEKKTTRKKATKKISEDNIDKDNNKVEEKKVEVSETNN